jgi:hypothetical protein
LLGAGKLQVATKRLASAAPKRNVHALQQQQLFTRPEMPLPGREH